MLCNTCRLGWKWVWQARESASPGRHCVWWGADRGILWGFRRQKYVVCQRLRTRAPWPAYLGGALQNKWPARAMGWNGVVFKSLNPQAALCSLWVQMLCDKQSRWWVMWICKYTRCTAGHISMNLRNIQDKVNNLIPTGEEKQGTPQMNNNQLGSKHCPNNEWGVSRAFILLNV